MPATSEVSTSPETESVMKDQEININEMISGSTSDVSVSDLSRRGFKKVKLLNQETIKHLINRSVQNVLQARQEEITARERKKVAEKSREEFERLLKEKLGQIKEKSRKDREKLQARQDEASRLKQELEKTQKALSEAEGRIEKLNGELTERKEEIERYEEETGRHREVIEDLEQKLEEERKKAEADTGQKQENSEVKQLTSAFRELIQEIRQGTFSTGKEQVGEIKKTMEGLAKQIAKGMEAGPKGKAAGGFDVDSTADVMAALLKSEESSGLESNIKKVTVKKQKTKKGVSDSLNKLRNIQKKGGS